MNKEKTTENGLPRKLVPIRRLVNSTKGEDLSKTFLLPCPTCGSLPSISDDVQWHEISCIGENREQHLYVSRHSLLETTRYNNLVECEKKIFRNANDIHSYLRTPFGELEDCILEWNQVAAMAWKILRDVSLEEVTKMAQQLIKEGK